MAPQLMGAGGAERDSDFSSSPAQCLIAEKFTTRE